MRISAAFAVGLLVLGSGLLGCPGRADRPADAGVPATRVPSTAIPVTPGAETFQVGGEVSAPRLLNRIEPRIPEQCVHRRFEGGAVIYEAVITETGDVEGVRVVKAPKFSPPCPEFEIETRRAISRWKYEPGKRKGIPVRTALTITQIIDVR